MKQYIITKDNVNEVFAELGQIVDKNVEDGLIVEIRKYDRQRDISYQQMKYLHCDNGPFKMFAEYQGCSPLEAEIQLKRDCGEHLFYRPLSMRTIDKLSKQVGDSYYECTNPACRKLFQTSQVKLVQTTRYCPMCDMENPRLIMILSKTELTTKQCNEWIDNMIQFLHEYDINVQEPNRDWRK